MVSKQVTCSLVALIAGVCSFNMIMLYRSVKVPLSLSLCFPHSVLTLSRTCSLTVREGLGAVLCASKSPFVASGHF